MIINRYLDKIYYSTYGVSGDNTVRPAILSALYTSLASDCFSFGKRVFRKY